MENSSRRNNQIRISVNVMLLITMIWLLWIMGQRTPAYHVANENIVFTPGRSIFAYYQLFFLASLLPIARIVGQIWLPIAKDLDTNQRSVSRGKKIKAQYISLAVWLSVSAGVAGYGYEAMQARLVISSTSVVVREGAGSRTILWNDIQEMRVDLEGNQQIVRFGSDSNSARVDLKEFNGIDRALIVREITKLAGLQKLNRSTPTLWIYKRIQAPLQLPQ